MGLLPLEFTDCLTDSPYFRENLHAHEHELDSTNSQIKDMIKDVKELLSAAKSKCHFNQLYSFRGINTNIYFAALSKAQRQMANTLSNFTFNSIGGSQTDDEIVIGRITVIPFMMLTNHYDSLLFTHLLSYQRST